MKLWPAMVKFRPAASSAFICRATCSRFTASLASADAHRKANRARLHHGRRSRRQATQFTKKRMWRASSCITVSNTASNPGDTNFDSRASLNRPKAKNESKHSAYPVLRKSSSKVGRTRKRLGGNGNRVVLGEGLDQPGVASLFEALQRNGFAHLGSGSSVTAR